VSTRKRRANGEESRLRIIQAATEVAGERGYEGTSIALVSDRSGLPASSIYWHFAGKDALIAAVIENSFDRWLAAMGDWSWSTPSAQFEESFVAAMQSTAKTIVESPDFLRLGLMLTLERRPVELLARSKFLELRQRTFDIIFVAYRQLFDETDRGRLDDAAVRSMVSLAMAGTDGILIAYEADGDAVDVIEAFTTLAYGVLGAADRLRVH
jgi:AcrR family transcriptional regulator